MRLSLTCLWIKANPSPPAFPNLLKEMRSDAVKAQYQPHKAVDLLTKRFNLPKEEAYTVVAPWEKIQATNKPIPYDKLKGQALNYSECTIRRHRTAIVEAVAKALFDDDAEFTPNLRRSVA